MELHRFILISLSISVNGLVGRSYIDDNDNHRHKLQNQQANLLEHKDLARKELVAELNGTTAEATTVALLGKQSSFFDEFECEYK